MAVFECSGVLGRILQLVYRYSYLQSIPPTSVEAECAFSATGTLCTKICPAWQTVVCCILYVRLSGLSSPVLNEDYIRQ